MRHFNYAMRLVLHEKHALQAYKNYIETVLNRVNTYNGRVYKSDPAVFSWELANEAGSTADQTGQTVSLQINCTCMSLYWCSNHTCLT